MANNYVDMPIIAIDQDKETQEERCGSSNCQYKIRQLLLTNKYTKYYSHQLIILYGNTENIGYDKGQKLTNFCKVNFAVALHFCQHIVIDANALLLIQWGKSIFSAKPVLTLFVYYHYYYPCIILYSIQTLLFIFYLF